MQAAKDSFVMFLCGALTDINASRTVTIDGVTRPAVLVCENERAELESAVEGAFCIAFGAVAPNAHGPSSVECAISYFQRGSEDRAGADRGRKLSEMDGELTSMLAPRRTPKMEFTAETPVALASNVFWGTPTFEAAKQDGNALRRTAKLKLYFYQEAA